MSTVSKPLKIATSHQHVLASVTLENAFEGRATATSTMGCCRPVPTQDLTTDSPVWSTHTYAVECHCRSSA